MKWHSRSRWHNYHCLFRCILGDLNHLHYWSVIYHKFNRWLSIMVIPKRTQVNCEICIRLTDVLVQFSEFPLPSWKTTEHVELIANYRAFSWSNPVNSDTLKASILKHLLVFWFMTVRSINIVHTCQCKRLLIFSCFMWKLLRTVLNLASIISEYDHYITEVSRTNHFSNNAFDLKQQNLLVNRK